MKNLALYRDIWKVDVPRYGRKNVLMWSLNKKNEWTWGTQLLNLALLKNDKYHNELIQAVLWSVGGDKEDSETTACNIIL